jgi:hypothetical protein
MMSIFGIKKQVNKNKTKQNGLILNLKNYQLKTKGMLEQSGFKIHLLSFEGTKPQLQNLEACLR